MSDKKRSHEEIAKIAHETVCAYFGTENLWDQEWFRARCVYIVRLQEERPHESYHHLHGLWRAAHREEKNPLNIAISEFSTDLRSREDLFCKTANALLAMQATWEETHEKNISKWLDDRCLRAIVEAIASDDSIAFRNAARAYNEHLDRRIGTRLMDSNVNGFSAGVRCGFREGQKAMQVAVLETLTDPAAISACKALPIKPYKFTDAGTGAPTPEGR